MVVEEECLENGLKKVPGLGFMSNGFGHCINKTQFQTQYQAIIQGLCIGRLISENIYALANIMFTE